MTSTVKLKLPDSVGMPLISPVAGFRFNPFGSDEPAARLQINGGTPVACKKLLYEEFLIASGNNVVVISRGAITSMLSLVPSFPPPVVVIITPS